jgi:hypothetical protein
MEKIEINGVKYELKQNPERYQNCCDCCFEDPGDGECNFPNKSNNCWTEEKLIWIKSE